jgi:desulfoferrodoxin (superoxide reductase-like protein)
MKRIAFLISSVFVWFCLTAGVSLANKASVSIEGPKSAEQGSEVTLRLTVTHSANTFFHYTKLLKVQVNGKPLTEWDFTSSNRPEDAVFTREVKIRVTGNTEVVAEAFCNIHGSAGPAKVVIVANETGSPAAKPND